MTSQSEDVSARVLESLDSLLKAKFRVLCTLRKHDGEKVFMDLINDVRGLNETLRDRAMIAGYSQQTKKKSSEMSSAPTKEEQLNSAYNKRVLVEEKAFMEWITDTSSENYTSFEIQNMLTEYHSIFDSIRRDHVAATLRARDYFGTKFIAIDCPGFVALSLQEYKENDVYVVQKAVLKDTCHHLVKSSRHTEDIDQQIHDLTIHCACFTEHVVDRFEDSTTPALTLPDKSQKMTPSELKDIHRQEVEIQEKNFKKRLSEVEMFDLSYEDVAAITEEHMKSLETMCRRHCVQERLLKQRIGRLGTGKSKSSSDSDSSDEEPEFDLETDWQFTDSL